MTGKFVGKGPVMNNNGWGGVTCFAEPVINRDRNLVGAAGLESQQRHGMRRGKIIEAPLPGSLSIAHGYADSRSLISG